MNKVPNQYVGLWQRLSLRDTDGAMDTDTRVYWLQTRSLYCDIRVPQPRPSFEGCMRLSDCDGMQLEWLARQQGFAGALEAQGDECRWHRYMDFQPDTGQDDVGHMYFHDGLLIEHGVYADYREEWERLTAPTDEVLAMELLSETSPDGSETRQPGYLLAVGDYFMFVRPRTVDTPAAASLADVVHEPCSVEQLVPLLDFEISLGRRGGARVPWEITLSTLPFREGRPLITQDDVPVPGEGGHWIQETTRHGGPVARRWLAHDMPADFPWL
jgi:hypothetical protein